MEIIIIIITITQQQQVNDKILEIYRPKILDSISSERCRDTLAKKKDC